MRSAHRKVKVFYERKDPQHTLFCRRTWYCLDFRVRKTHVSWWHCHLESFCASGKFLRVSMKSTIKRHAQMHRFPGGLQSFRMVWKVFGLVGNCCKNIMMFMSQKRFTHFFDAFVAITICALRPERFCTLKSATRKILTF